MLIYCWIQTNKRFICKMEWMHSFRGPSNAIMLIYGLMEKRRTYRILIDCWCCTKTFPPAEIGIKCSAFAFSAFVEIKSAKRPKTSEQLLIAKFDAFYGQTVIASLTSKWCVLMVYLSHFLWHHMKIHRFYYQIALARKI